MPSLEAKRKNLEMSQWQKAYDNIKNEIQSSHKKVLYHFVLNDICEHYPDHVKNITHTDNPACVVTEQNILDKTACEYWEKEYLDYVEEDLLPCDMANELFENKGCGELGCTQIK